MFGIDLQTENVAKLIQLALGPVFLLSGVGITLSMLTARLARIVDRARTLEDRREAQSDSARIAHIDEDLRFIVRRTRYINSAIALSTTSAFLTALVVTMLFASAFTPLNIGVLIAATFVASLTCLSLSFLMFLFEVRIATRSPPCPSWPGSSRGGVATAAGRRAAAPPAATTSAPRRIAVRNAEPCPWWRRGNRHEAASAKGPITDNAR